MLIRTDEHADIATPTGPMRVHLARPAGPGRFAAIALYSEIYQITDPIRRLAAQLAGEGFIVAMPEVYHEHEAAGSVLAYDTPGTERGNALKFAKPAAGHDSDASALFDWLAAHPACTGALGTFGVCLGGHLALRAALDARVGAAVCFYPTDLHSRTLGRDAGGDDTMARIGELRGEAMLVFGRQDPHVPFDGRSAIRARLEEAGRSFTWFEVNAQHAFLRDGAPRFDAMLARLSMGWALAHFSRWLTPPQATAAAPGASPEAG